jgi:hypothetical protein
MMVHSGIPTENSLNAQPMRMRKRKKPILILHQIIE